MMKRLVTVVVMILMFFVFHEISPAQIFVKGVVLDQNSRKPLPGANVVVSELKQGVSTDADGNFTLKFPTAQKHFDVQVSYVGYRDTVLIVKAGKEMLRVLLQPDPVLVPSFIVTANRIKQNPEEAPQRVDVITPDLMESYPATNTDDILRLVPGVNVNRSWGIFSRNASVTMRAMPGSTRSLILIDGSPLNKTAGGTISWHLVSPAEIERIEVVKGPGSALYGNNAMGGVINIITKKPRKNLEGTVELGLGSLGTYSAQANVLGRNMKDSKGFYWKMGGFYRQGDGYMLELPENRDSTTAKAYLQEGNANAMVGYQFSDKSRLELDYRFYKDKRGAGIKVYEADGSFERFTNNNFQSYFTSRPGKLNLQARAFYFVEGYQRQDEKVNTSGEFKLVDTDTDKTDMGIWITTSTNVGRYQKLIAGLDIKHGDLNNEEIYRTSTDHINTRGKLFFTGIFVQDEISLMKDQILLSLGVRVDRANFYDGGLKVTEPTSKTGFPAETDESFEAVSWTEFSPKIGMKYLFHPSLNFYLNAGTGFMPPRLDDLAGSRKIRRGFKIANPDLKPERLQSIDFGLNWSFRDKLEVQPTAFYSVGTDFQYLVATGDFIDSGSEDPVPVYQRQNVTKVAVSGVELGVNYAFNAHLKLIGSYAYNTSEILEYSSPDGLELEGLALNEVPENLLSVGLSWKSKIADVYVEYAFTDDQWYDEENTEIIEGYNLVNASISKKFFNRFRVTMDIRDLLDEQFIDRKGYLSPGRFFMFGLKYHFINQKQ